jgi:hypothetical protein
MYLDNEDIPILQEVIDEFQDDFLFFKTDEETNPSTMPKDWHPIVIDTPILINDFTSETSMTHYRRSQDLCRYMDYTIFHRQA